jgi:hypothetical protein
MCEATDAPAISYTEYDDLVAELPTETERTQVAAAIKLCSFRTTAELVDPWRVLALLRLEDILDIPDDVRGLLPAVWCIEASMRLQMRDGSPVRGDHRPGKGYISQGPFQMSETLRNVCGGTEGARHDLIWAARCWVANIYRVLPKAAAACPKKAWVHAEALIANPRVYRGQCRIASKHYQLIGK